jgi:HSP20 family molecular chaperone IbpA
MPITEVIGMRDFDVWFKDLDWLLENPKTREVPRYPLTDLMIDKDTDDVVIRVALAGFGKDDIQIEKNGNKLVISGDKKEVDYSEKYDIVRKHISDKSFERIVVLHDKYVDGDVNANFSDGILTIKIKPIEKQKQLIEIN